MTLIYYTQSTGRYYVNGEWIGEFAVDVLGNVRDMESGTVLC